MQSLSSSWLLLYKVLCLNSSRRMWTQERIQQRETLQTTPYGTSGLRYRRHFLTHKIIMAFLLRVWLASLVGWVFCNVIAVQAQNCSEEVLPYPNRPIIEFSIGTWAENLAVRHNGQILVTRLDSPQLLQVDPLSLQELFVIHQFADPDKGDGVIGIVEMEPDVFYVVVGNFTISDTEGTPGTYSIWKVDMNPFRGGTNGTIITPAVVNKITSLGKTMLPNGLTALDKHRSLLLIADCRQGAIWKLNLQTGEYEIVIKNPLMNPSSDPSSLGVNGIKIMNGYLYFTNTQAGNFSRIPIDTDGRATGPAEVLQTGLTTADDFVLDTKGDAYIAQDAGNVLAKVSANNWQVTILVGSLNDSYLAGATAVQFGRTALDYSVLYVTTNGGQAKPVNGKVVAGKVVAVYTETYAFQS